MKKYTRSIVDIEQYAAENKLRVVRPKSDQLLIDIDSEADFCAFLFRIRILQERHMGVAYVVNPSRNKPSGKHIIVTVPGVTFSPLERVAFQAVLGSDRTRELLSLFEILNGESDVSIFFEKL